MRDERMRRANSDNNSYIRRGALAAGRQRAVLGGVDEQSLMEIDALLQPDGPGLAGYDSQNQYGVVDPYHIPDYDGDNIDEIDLQTAFAFRNLGRGARGGRGAGRGVGRGGRGGRPPRQSRASEAA